MRPYAGLELQNRYRLVSRLALGGMGEVWRATDLRSGRAVAAKILRPELSGDEIFLSRLRAEAANSRSLRHPNLAIVLDAGEKDGSGWIIMELVQGRALSDILEERGTMDSGEILPILAQVARALQVVHDAGVVHRDVKPSNILINEQGLAKLTDFGISTGINQRPMTATGMVMGTAQYLSPEQAMGNMATPAGDLYALGVIAYEALVGHRPFTGATQVDIAFAHVNEKVPPMPETIPQPVRDVVMELLAKRAIDRPSSARAVARRLDRIVVNLPAETWDPSAPLSWTTVSTGTNAGSSPSQGRAAASPSRGVDGGPTAGKSAGRAPGRARAGRATGRAAERPGGRAVRPDAGAPSQRPTLESLYAATAAVRSGATPRTDPAGPAAQANASPSPAASSPDSSRTAAAQPAPPPAHGSGTAAAPPPTREVPAVSAMPAATRPAAARHASARSRRRSLFGFGLVLVLLSLGLPSLSAASHIIDSSSLSRLEAYMTPSPAITDAKEAL